MLRTRYDEANPDKVVLWFTKLCNDAMIVIRILQVCHYFVMKLLEVALGYRASAIIYQNIRFYGDCPLIIAINASTRQLTVQPNATPRNYATSGAQIVNILKTRSEIIMKLNIRSS